MNDFNQRMDKAFDGLGFSSARDEGSSRHFSLLNVPYIKQSFLKLRFCKMKEFHEQMDDIGLPNLSYDLDKLIMIETVEYFYEQAIEAFRIRDQDSLVQSMTYIAYISLIKKEN